jgi:hypothetical protein
MSRLTTALFALGIALVSTGCVTRQVTRFEDNQKSPLTLLEVKKTTTFFSPIKVVYQFYMCQDTGEKLVCKLSCDGANDVVCPAAAGSGGVGTTTNVR